MTESFDIIDQGPQRARRRIILAHGAGADMESDFMAAMAEGLVEQGIRVVRFNFPYMQQRKATGKKRPPDRQPKLLDHYRALLDHLGGAEKWFIGGKSMGGRMASLIADEVQAKGLICLGYPFHPPGKPDNLRTEHLQTLKTPALILQGTRDALGKQEEVVDYPLAKTIQVQWLEDGDHSFKPRKKSGHTEQEHWQAAVEAIALFVNEKS